MPKIFFSTKLPFIMKQIMNVSALQAWITGNMRDTNPMKQRVKLGYEGAITDDVNRYDEMGTNHYIKIASELLKEVNLKDKKVLDVGCGTGIISEQILKQGAAKLDSGDLAENMLNQWKTKALDLGYNEDQVNFHLIDAESLPFDNNSYDVVVSSMVLGIVPDQIKMLSEMKRVLRPGGTIALSTHGPEHYCEGSRAACITILKNFSLDIMGYRLELWSLDEKGLKKLMAKAGLNDIQTQKLFWQDDLGTPDNAYDFCASTSSMWWYGIYKPQKREKIARKVRETYTRMGITKMTQDVTLAFGTKI